jgi:hypothetical protein
MPRHECADSDANFRTHAGNARFSIMFRDLSGVQIVSRPMHDKRIGYCPGTSGRDLW